MRSLTFRFVLFAVVLIGPIGLLVQRALQSIAVERELREQTVAERIFDEMERNLSSFLSSEERLAVERYERSPVDPSYPFVVRRFHLAAQDSEPDSRAGAAAAPPRARGSLAETVAEEEKLDEQIGLGSAVARLDDSDQATAQAPGTTVRLDAKGSFDRSSPNRKDEGRPTAYDTLRFLNKAVQDRLVDRLDSRADPSERRSVFLSNEEDGPRKQSAYGLLPRSERALGPRLSGHALDQTQLVLSRSVELADQRFRQGVVLDIVRLGNWLRSRSIAGVPVATLEFFTEVTASSHGSSEAPAYRHRFAPPFADLSAQLRLQSRGSGESERYVQLLSSALIAATLIGLVLLYRTVDVTVRFAERRNNFVAAVSHELKTPLTAIRMYGEMLRDGVVPSESKRMEYYRHITNESERLSRLINNVLEYSKLEKGDRRVDLVTGSIRPTVEKVVEMIRPHAVEQGFELSLSTEPELPAVRFEADAVMQILWNLVDNAIKYARNATDRRIELVVERDGDFVRASVRDHGPGVEGRQLGEIFAPFYRAEDELTRTAKGTGLGLALVKSLADQMGARVDARNAPDGGLTVELRWPIADAKSD